MSGASGIFLVGVLSTTWLRFQSFPLLYLIGGETLPQFVHEGKREGVGGILISVHHGFSVMVKNT